jgi:splicing factor 3B subunit 3
MKVSSLVNFINTQRKYCLFFIIQILDALNEGHSQIFLGCGKGPCSVLKTLKYGASVEELADNQLPGTPLAVWTLRNSLTAEHDNLIVVSFSNSTLVLSIEDTVSEVTETNFLRNTSTLHVALLEDNSHVQVVIDYLLICFSPYFSLRFIKMEYDIFKHKVAWLSGDLLQAPE